MKKLLFIAFLVGVGAMLGGGMVCRSHAGSDGHTVYSASRNTVTVPKTTWNDHQALAHAPYSAYLPDMTEIQNWVEDHPCPLCSPPDGWCDVIGDSIFQTYYIHVEWSEENVILHIYTDFPQEGYGDGTEIGYPGKGKYQVADLAIDLNLDGVWETGIALVAHGPIPQDPSNASDRQPPGHFLPAVDIIQGKLYSVSSWFSAADIHFYHGSRAGLYDKAAPKNTLAWMRLAEESASVQVSWTTLPPPGPAYRVDILLENVNTSGQWDAFKICWGTATCCNDVIEGSVGEMPPVPTMTLWGTFIFLAGLCALGTYATVARRKRAN